MSQTPRLDRDERNAAGSWAFRLRRTTAGIGAALASRSREGILWLRRSTGPHVPRSPIPCQGKEGIAEELRSGRPIAGREHACQGWGNGERKKPRRRSTPPWTHGLSPSMPARSAWFRHTSPLYRLPAKLTVIDKADVDAPCHTTMRCSRSASPGNADAREEQLKAAPPLHRRCSTLRRSARHLLLPDRRIDQAVRLPSSTSSKRR